MTHDNGAYDKLVIEVEVVGFNANQMLDGAEFAAAPENGGSGDVAEELLFELTEYVMRPQVGLTIVTQPGDKEQNSDFEVKAMDGIVVGARIIRSANAR